VRKSEDQGDKFGPEFGAVQRAVVRTSGHLVELVPARHSLALCLLWGPPPLLTHAFSALSLELRPAENLASQSGCLISPNFHFA